MNLEELRDARRTERERDGLQSLPDSFYRDVAAYLADLKAERERAAAAADDPFSNPEVRELTEEIETAEEVVESIYERRVGKVVDRASFAAADMRHETEGLTAEERDLFDDLVARIERNRDRVLDALDPDADADADADANADADATGARSASTGHGDAARAGTGDGADDAPDPSDLLAEAMGGAPDDASATDASERGDRTTAGATPDGTGTTDGGVPTGTESGDGAAAATPGTDPSAAPATADDTGSPAPPPRGDASEGGDGGAGTAGSRDAGREPDRDAGRAEGDVPDPERRTVYVTRDVGEILGVDERTYRLAAEDVVDLPADNARALVERDAAEPLE